MISYHGTHGGKRALIDVGVLLPSEHFQRVWELAKLLIGRRDLRYVLSVNFLGLRVEERTSAGASPGTRLPTFAEFTLETPDHRCSYISDEVEFNVRPRDDSVG